MPGPRPTAEPSAAAGGSVVSGLPVIGLAHGSRLPESGADIESLMTEVGRRLGVPSRAAYLDLAEPDLAMVAAGLAGAGHERAVVVPLLFTVAFHATVDTPQAVRDAALSSGLDLVVSDIIGTADDLVDALSAHLAHVPAAADLLLVAVGSSNAAANAEVNDLARRLEARRGVRVASAFATCDPRPSVVAEELGPTTVIVPLFLADGLLLGPLRALGAERGWVMLPPLGERAAGIVCVRYRNVVSSLA